MTKLILTSLMLVCSLWVCGQMQHEDSVSYLNVAAKLDSLNKVMQIAELRATLIKRNTWMRKDIDSAYRCIARHDLENGYLMIDQAGAENKQCIWLVSELKKLG